MCANCQTPIIQQLGGWYFEVLGNNAHWKSSYWDDYACRPDMEFRLVYEGPLPAAGRSGGAGRNPDKHRIRRYLHPQLKQLWKVQRPLSEIAALNHEYPLPDGTITKGNGIEALSAHYSKFGFRFVPAINKRYGWVCDLDILFLRREEAGAVINGGDIDNRLKVLFDALRVPENWEEIKDEKPGLDEDPFFCLMESDSLITSLTVSTDRLLRPLQTGQSENDVVLVMRVIPRIANNASSPYVLY